MTLNDKMTSMPEVGFIRQSRLATMLPFSAATLWRKVRKNTFPQPVKLSARITAWRVEDIRAWMASVSHNEAVAA